MAKNKRQEAITQIVRDYRKVSSSFLAKELKVSKDTIRRDLNQLDRRGILLKTHGGAISSIQKLYHYNEDVIFNKDKKNIIASKAIKLLKDKDVILISGGTTNLMLAKMLPKELKATVYTYSLPIALQLTEHPFIEVIFIGGKIQKKSMVTIGIDVIQVLAKLKIDICFMGVSGLSHSHGITDEGYEVSLIKKVMINASEQVVYLVASNKLNIRYNFKVCNLNEIDIIVTNLDPTDPELKEYIASGVNLI